jgi:replicative DNA helicase
VLIAGIVEPKHFIEPIHQQIYEVACALIQAGKLATPVTLKSFLPGDLDVVGLPLQKYLARLCAEATTIINAPDFAREIVRLADCRHLISIGTELVETARNAPVEADTTTIASCAIDNLDALATARAVNHTPRISIGDAATEAIQRMSAVRVAGGGLTGITSGLRSLDAQTQGWHWGEVVVLAGRPGMGKTGVALSSALRSAMALHPTLFFSLEMAAAPLANRCIADLLFGADEAPSYWDIAAGGQKLTSAQDDAVGDVARSLGQVPLLIEQTPALSVAQIAARVRRYKNELERKGRKLDLVVVDHMHLVKPSDRYQGSRVNEITEISGGLKALAKELNVAVVALAQLSRNVEGRGEKRPTMADLRDSGSIEQDADLVIFAFREEYYLSQRSSDRQIEDRRIARLAESRNQLELIISKHRNGPTATVRIFFNCAANAARDLAVV